MFIIFSDTLSSGLASKRTIEILRGSYIFRPFIELLEQKKKLKSLWVDINLDGSHPPFFQDKLGQDANYKNLIRLAVGIKECGSTATGLEGCVGFQSHTTRS